MGRAVLCFPRLEQIAVKVRQIWFGTRGSRRVLRHSAVHRVSKGDRVRSRSTFLRLAGSMAVLAVFMAGLSGCGKGAATALDSAAAGASTGAAGKSSLLIS